MTEPDPAEPARRKALWLAGAAAACLGLGTGFYFLSAVSEPAAPAPSQELARFEPPRTVTIPPKSEDPLPGDAKPEDANLQVLRDEGDAYEKTLEALNAQRDVPSAERFARDFVADPELRGDWERFKSDRDRTAFVETLRRSPAFSRLMSRYAPEPGFKAAAEAVADKLGLSPWIHALASLRKRAPH